MQRAHAWAWVMLVLSATTATGSAFTQGWLEWDAGGYPTRAWMSVSLAFHCGGNSVCGIDPVTLGGDVARFSMLLATIAMFAVLAVDTWLLLRLLRLSRRLLHRGVNADAGYGGSILALVYVAACTGVVAIALWFLAAEIDGPDLEVTLTGWHPLGPLLLLLAAGLSVAVWHRRNHWLAID